MTDTVEIVRENKVNEDTPWQKIYRWREHAWSPLAELPDLFKVPKTLK